MKKILETSNKLFKDSISLSFRFEEIWLKIKKNNMLSENGKQEIFTLTNKVKILLNDLESELKELESKINETR